MLEWGRQSDSEASEPACLHNHSLGREPSRKVRNLMRASYLRVMVKQSFSMTAAF